MSAQPPTGDVMLQVLEELRRQTGALERLAAAIEDVRPARPPARDPDERLKVSEVAEEFRIGLESLRAAIALGKLPAHNPSKRLTTVRRGDVVAWLAGDGDWKPARRSTASRSGDGRGAA